jgi:hypothetical protein
MLSGVANLLELLSVDDAVIDWRSCLIIMMWLSTQWTSVPSGGSLPGTHTAHLSNLRSDDYFFVICWASELERESLMLYGYLLVGCLLWWIM